MLEYYDGQKLCIFISKNDKYEGIVLYELLLEIAFNSRLSGGTVTIGDKGFFGARDESTKLKILRSAENLPVVLEFQGRADRVVRYIERIQPMIKEGLITLADVQIMKFNSPDEDIEDSESEENEDQSQIFNAKDDESTLSDSQQENSSKLLDEDGPESIRSDSGIQDEATSHPEDDESDNSVFLEPDEDPEIEDDQVDTPEPDVEIPSFDDDEPDIPEFQSLDDDQINNENEDDILEAEDDAFIEEEFEEESPALQLSDLSETQDEAGDEDNFKMDDPDETIEDTSNSSEFAEPKTEDEIDALFEESSEKFENTFDDMLKQAGGATVDDAGLDSEEKKTESKDPVESPGDEAEENDAAKSKTYDKNHTEDEMKDYFSSLFKKSD